MKKLFIFAMLVFAGTCIAIAVNDKAKTDKAKTEINTETQEVYDCKRCDGSGYDRLTQTCPSCQGRKKSTRSERCGTCSGSGVVTDRYGDKVTCPTCKGERMKITIETCSSCNGKGDIPMKCRACNGTGKVTR